MKPPVRLIEEPGSLPEELLAGMQAYSELGPSERELAQVRVGVKLQTIASMTAWKGLALAAAIGGAATWMMWPPAPARERERSAAPIPAPERTEAKEPGPANAPVPQDRTEAKEPGAANVPVPQDTRALAQEEARAPLKASRPAARAQRAPAGDPVAELALLRRARLVLASDPATALALTEQHLQSYPQGVFAEERELLAIEALSQRDRNAATERARAFATKYPRSVHQPRIEAALGAR